MENPTLLNRMIGDRKVCQPEKRLLLALLEGAVSDFQRYASAPNGRGRRLFADVSAWFGSTSHDRFLDFESICDGLGLDPSFLRTGLDLWRAARCARGGTDIVGHA
jgi:hypothetical protein